MESKLKALKVVELKEILSKASVTVTGKANKADLIAKILASPEALAVFTGASRTAPVASATPATQSEPAVFQAYTSSAEPTIPPASETEDVTPTETPALSSTSKAEPVPTEILETAVTADASQTQNLDPELEKRKARAARFGIPLLETTKPKTPRVQQGKRPAKDTKIPEEAEKLNSRAERFGTQNSKPAEQRAARGNKRAAPATETVDAEELERRRKRAERFGTNKPDFLGQP